MVAAKRQPVKAGPTRRKRARAARQSMLLWLGMRFPDVFDPKRPTPLAVGIHAEINYFRQVHGQPVNRNVTWSTLFHWCRQPAYLRALIKPHARRRHLDGTDAGPVLPEHAQVARMQLAQRQPRKKPAARKKTKARKKATIIKRKRRGRTGDHA